MATRVERGRTRWQSAVTISGAVLLLGSLAVAQDPAPAQAPSPAAQTPSTRAEQIEQLEARLRQVEEGLRTNEVEWLELHDPDSILVWAFLSYTTGGERPNNAYGESIRRQRLEAERVRLTAERDEIQQALIAARYTAEPSISPVDLLDFIEGRTAAQAEDLIDTTAYAPTSSSSMSLSMDLGARFYRDAQLSIFTTAPPAGQEQVNGWGEFQADEDQAPVSGQVLVSRAPDADDRFSFTGLSGDGSTAMSGEFHASLNSTSDPLTRGTGYVTLVTPDRVRQFYGTAFFAHRYDGRNANIVFENADGTGAVPQAPSLNLIEPGEGGPVIRDRQFFFFGPAGRKIAEGTGTWRYGGGSALTFQSERPGFQVTLNYSRDRATGAFETGSTYCCRYHSSAGSENRAAGSLEPGSNAGEPTERIDLDIDRLFDRTPRAWIGTAWLDPVIRDPSAIAASVATYHTATGDIAPSDRVVATAPSTRPPEARIGFSFLPESRSSSLPESRSSSLAALLDLRDHTVRLNSPAVNALRVDTSSQLGAGRLVTAPTERQARTSPPLLLASRLADAIRGVFRARHAMSGAPSRFASAWQQRDATPARRSQSEPEAPVVYFRSLGRSTGSDAIEMTYIGDAPLAPGLDNLLVLEPVSRSEARRVEQQIANAARGRPVATMKLVMYCLNHRLLTPVPGQIMRLASAATHKQFMHVLSIWDSADRARQDGTLTPDSDPEDYYHSIIQWAIWTKEQGFDERAFGDAFAEHTRKNLEQAGQKWSRDAETVVRSVVPNRWRDILTVLR